MQYLLNATAIWLISLLAFDIFLRRESYHGYNRFYLLSTFILGLVVPLLQLMPDSYLQPAFQQPVERVINVKEQVVNTAAETTVDTQQWLWIIYLAGVGISLCFLIAEVIKLIGYYRGAHKWQQGNWTIVETGKEHAPFSFMKILFVRTAAQYTDTEWQMLFNHEKQHAERAHVIDLLLMQLSKALFWFHPLVYIYNKRLLMVHEYQADSTPAVSPSVYGHFLVEQAVLGAAPVLSHSFNRSPIKKRIVMLTRRSGTAARTKMLAFIPVAAVSLLCFSQSVFSQKMEQKGNIVTFRGNKFELSEVQTDTIEMTDPTTGNTFTRVVKTDPSPKKMNGNKIYNIDEVSAHTAYVGPDGSLWGHVMKGLKDNLLPLGDGEYVLNVNNFIVDGNGDIVYFKYFDVEKITNKKASPDGISKDMQQKVQQLVVRQLVSVKGMQPAVKDGKKVTSTVYDEGFWRHFKIENGKFFIQDKNNNWTEL